MQINIKEARQRFSELVNTVALKRERVVITSRNKPKAVLISVQDAETLEQDKIRRARRQMQLQSLKEMREKLASKRPVSNSLGTLERLREERLGHLSGND
jgi:prevent-host-death family protein